MLWSSVPISGAVATCDRPEALRRTLELIAAQDILPSELIFVDASIG